MKTSPWPCRTTCRRSALRRSRWPPGGWIGHRTCAGASSISRTTRMHGFGSAWRWHWERRATRTVSALARIARRDGSNRWIRTAVLSSCASTADRLFAELATAGAPEMLEPLVAIVGARNRPDEVNRVLDVLAARAGDARDRLVLALARAVRRSGGRLPIEPAPARPGAALVARLLQGARTSAQDEQTPEPALLDAVEVLSTIDPDGSRALLLDRLAPRQPTPVQLAVVRAMAEGRIGGRPRRLAPPAPGVRAVGPRGGDPDAARPRRLDEGPAAIDDERRTRRDQPERDRAFRPRTALEEPRPRDRAAGTNALRRPVNGLARAVIAEYAAALRIKGDAARGAKVFERECKACHKVGDRGFALGPDLAGSPSADPAALLANILDPSAVRPARLSPVPGGRPEWADLFGRDRRRDGDQPDPPPRRRRRRYDPPHQVAEIAGTGLSMMPEGFEKTIARPEMADLIAFLRASHRGGEGEGPDAGDRSRPLDIGTLPGLIEPEDPR